MALYSGAIDYLRADVTQRIGQGAAVAAAIVSDHLAAGPRSGVHWPELPRRSSAPGEYPQEQFGPLRASIGHDHVGGTTWEAGAIHNPPEEAAKLEFSPVSEGGRPWLSRAMEDPETHEVMLRAALLDE